MQTSAEFDSYVARLEGIARANPGGYRTRVLLFGALGYVYVFGVLAALVAVLVAVGLLVTMRGGMAILIKAAIPILIVVWTVLRAMWVRIPPPEGKEIAREDAPRLFDEIDTIRRAVDAPPAHHVLLNDDFNAAVAQVPRLGMFGWHRNYLMLGVPLMHALPRDEFRAVLAHEFGHLSRAHGRSGAWIYRIRITWTNILESLEAERRATFSLRRFFAWYAPRFNAYSFVLARAQEFEADARAAGLVGSGVMASALTRIRVRSHHLHGTFWPTLWRRAAQEPEPPGDAYTALVQSFAAPVPPGDAEILVAEALAAPTRSDDTHPALAERIAALGVDPGVGTLVAPDEGPSAADVYLDRASWELIQRLNRSWREEARPGWEQQHQEARQAAARLAALESSPVQLTDEEAKERAWLVFNLRGTEEALPLFHVLAAAHPSDAQIRSMLGHLLLDSGDEAGLRHLELAMSADIGLVRGGCGAAYAFLQRAGRLEEAERYWVRLREHEDLMYAAQAERGAGALKPGDVFLPHGMDDDAARAIKEVLRRHRDIASAYLVRKQVKVFADVPMYVLAVVPDWTWKRGQSGDHSAELVNRLVAEVPFPADAVILTLEGALKKLRKPITRVPGADVYVRGRRAVARAS
jgi:Zn-dependent protease with chaperone function